jgi:tRNA U55 pseudouridine synthase TruB
VIKSFLGMSFEYNAKKLYWHITQGIYIKDLCKTMGLTQGASKVAHTPEIKQTWSEEASTAKSEAERLRVRGVS